MVGKGFFFLSNWQIADQLQMEKKPVGISCPLVTFSWKSFAFKNYFLGQMKVVENLRELLGRQRYSSQNYYPNMLGC